MSRRAGQRAGHRNFRGTNSSWFEGQWQLAQGIVWLRYGFGVIAGWQGGAQRFQGKNSDGSGAALSTNQDELTVTNTRRISEKGGLYFLSASYVFTILYTPVNVTIVPVKMCFPHNRLERIEYGDDYWKNNLSSPGYCIHRQHDNRCLFTRRTRQSP